METLIVIAIILWCLAQNAIEAHHAFDQLKKEQDEATNNCNLLPGKREQELLGEDCLNQNW